MASIVEKMTPPAPDPELGAPTPALNPDQSKIIGIVVGALDAAGIKVTPEQVAAAAQPAQTLAPQPLVEPMTPTELTLLGRSQSFITDALRRHGITLGREAIWVGAEVADFVNGELARAGVGAEAQVATVPAPAAKQANEVLQT